VPIREVVTTAEAPLGI